MAEAAQSQCKEHVQDQDETVNEGKIVEGRIQSEPDHGDERQHNAPVKEAFGEIGVVQEEGSYAQRHDQVQHRQ